MQNKSMLQVGVGASIWSSPKCFFPLIVDDGGKLQQIPKFMNIVFFFLHIYISWDWRKNSIYHLMPAGFAKSWKMFTVEHSHFVNHGSCCRGVQSNKYCTRSRVTWEMFLDRFSEPGSFTFSRMSMLDFRSRHTLIKLAIFFCILYIEHSPKTDWCDYDKFSWFFIFSVLLQALRMARSIYYLFSKTYLEESGWYVDGGWIRGYFLSDKREEENRLPYLSIVSYRTNFHSNQLRCFLKNNNLSSLIIGI